MFCPQCGHQQVSNDMRFCSRCGLLLEVVTDLLANSSTQLQREKRELTGIGFMIAAIILLLNFMLVFGAITLPHLSSSAFLWLWLSFVIASLITGGAGLTNLIRSDFFKRLKGRELRLKLANAEQKRQMLPDESRNMGFNVESTPRLAEPLSVTEMTTRELQARGKAKRQDSSHREMTSRD